MKSRVCLFLLLLSLTATSLVYGQGQKKPRTEEDYYPRTLRDLSALQPPPFAQALKERDNKDLGVIVHGDLLPSRVKVVYEGATRPLNEKKKQVILSWANQFAGAPEFYTTPYQTEMLFTENGENYWLAVRTESLPKFEQELKKGEAVELFLIKMGSVRIERTDEMLEPVLLVEKYVKQ
ncbi:MAG TPA: hypothetical protein VFT08_08185 [Pyrinomonadaceae bacterium]|nr:hypothetical protein [Pyrinomonadaceae bacterium]